jgi:hypothetical protein
MNVSYAGERVPEIHFLHLRIFGDDGARWWVLRVSNQLTFGQLHEALSIVVPARQATWSFVLGGKRISSSDRRFKLARRLTPTVKALYLAERTSTLVVEGWSAILPHDPRILYLDSDDSRDVAIANAVLGAVRERSPGNLLN